MGGDLLAAADYILREEFEHVCALLTSENRLAVDISLHTGLRISDVLSLRSSEIKSSFGVTESKTGKRRVIHLTRELLERCQMQAEKAPHGWLFPGRVDHEKHRTRQAVYQDIKRAAVALRLPKCYQISPHSARKICAVDLFAKKRGDLKAVQKMLQHSDEAVTMLYAMADVLTERRLGRRKK